jgi:hypothetical protein
MFSYYYDYIMKTIYIHMVLKLKAFYCVNIFYSKITIPKNISNELLQFLNRILKTKKKNKMKIEN